METPIEKPSPGSLDLDGSAAAPEADAPVSRLSDVDVAPADDSPETSTEAIPEIPAEVSPEDGSVAGSLPHPDSPCPFVERSPLEPSVGLAPAHLSPRPVSRRMEKQIYDDGFAHGKAAAYEEFRQEQIAYYRNLRDAGARAFGKMPDSRPSGEFLASPRQGFWAD